ncbi:MAG TPA: nitronate monooxygenase [Kofleriaceae bacterium]
MGMGKNKSGLSRRELLGVAGGAGLALALGGTNAFAGRGSSSKALDTRLVRDYGAQFPIANAGMSFIGLHDLAIAVTNAGGIGMYGAAPEPPPVVEARLGIIGAAVGDKPFGVDFIIADSPLGTFTTQDHIDIAAAAHVPIVVFHWDIPPASWVSQLHAAGTRVWIQAGDADFVQRGLAVGADAIIVQGSSAGGHNRNSTIPTLAFIQLVRQRFSRDCMLLAAGGIGDGVSLVRAIEAGADGGWMGTRFVAATESYAHPDYKQRLVAARSLQATTFTTAFGPEWPGQHQRVLRNTATANPGATTPVTIGTTTLFPGIVDAPYTMPNHSAIVPTRDTVGDLDQMDQPAGSESVLAVNAVQSAQAIIQHVIAEAEAELASSCGRP